MHVWIVTVGEPLPLKGAEDRLYRSGVLSRYLLERGHRVTWITSNFDHFSKSFHQGVSDEVVLGENYRLVFLKGPSYRANFGIARFLNHLIVGFDFCRSARTWSKPDVILCSLPTLELSWLSVRYGRRFGVPVVLDVRDLWPDIFVDYAPAALKGLIGLASWPFFLLRNLALRGASGIVGVSRSYLNWGLEIAGRSQSAADAVIPIGYKNSYLEMSEQVDSKKISRPFEISSEVLLVTFIGTFGKSYDLDTIISAARLLNERNIPVHFLMCGDGEARRDLENRATNLSCITFTGWLDEQSLAGVLAASDIGLVAYRKFAPQSLPNKLFEYLSAGLPVVSSLKSEAQEIIATEGCGLSYMAEDASSLAHAIETLAADEDLRKRCARNARRIFTERYSLEHCYQEYTRYLEGVVHAYG